MCDEAGIKGVVCWEETMYISGFISDKSHLGSIIKEADIYLMGGFFVFFISHSYLFREKEYIACSVWLNQ